MDAAGIDHSIVLTSFKVNDRRPSLASVLGVADSQPRVSVVAGISYESYSAPDLSELRNLLGERRIRGFKL